MLTLDYFLFEPPAANRAAGKVIGNCFLASALLDAARVREKCFSLSFMLHPPRLGGGRQQVIFAEFLAVLPHRLEWAGGTSRTTSQGARSSAIPWRTGPEEAGAGPKPALKPTWKTTELGRRLGIRCYKHATPTEFWHQV